MPEHNHLPDFPEFEQAVLPHLDAAYNLAHWLTRNDQDAQDAVQEACLRAFRFFPRFRSGNARAWFMKIVRNTCYSSLRANRPIQNATEFDENLFHPGCRAPNPEEAVLQKDSGTLVRKALEQLPSNFRTVLNFARTGGDVLQRDRRHHRHACGYCDVQLVAWEGAPSSSCGKSYGRGVWRMPVVNSPKETPHLLWKPRK